MSSGSGSNNPVDKKTAENLFLAFLGPPLTDRQRASRVFLGLTNHGTAASTSSVPSTPATAPPTATPPAPSDDAFASQIREIEALKDKLKGNQ